MTFAMTLLLALANLVPALALANTETKEFDAAAVSRIEVNNGIGNVIVTTTTTDKVVVSADQKKFGKHCQQTIEMRDKTLFIEVKKTGFFKSACAVEFKISAPQNVALDLGTGSGDIKVTGTKGDLEFDTGSGSIAIDAEVAALRGQTGSGTIEAKGLTQGGSLGTGSGQIKLAFKSAPTEGELSLKTGSGGVEVTLPKTAKIRTSFMSGSGSMKSDLEDSPESKFKISVMSGSGDLRIKTQ